MEEALFDLPRLLKESQDVESPIEPTQKRTYDNNAG